MDSRDPLREMPYDSQNTQLPPQDFDAFDEGLLRTRSLEFNQQPDSSNLNHEQAPWSEAPPQYRPALNNPLLDEAVTDSNVMNKAFPIDHLMNDPSMNPNASAFTDDFGDLPASEPFGHIYHHGQNIISSTPQALSIDGPENTWNATSQHPDPRHYGNASQQNRYTSSQNQTGSKGKDRECNSRSALQQLNTNTMQSELNTGGPQGPTQFRKAQSTPVAEDGQTSSSSRGPPPAPQRRIESMTRKEMREEMQSTRDKTSVRYKAINTVCRPKTEIWKRLETGLSIADYDSLALTDRTLVESWMRAPRNYTRTQVTLVLQYFDQVSQVLGRQVVVEILRMRSTYEQQGDSQPQLSLHPLDPLVIFPGDPSSGSVQGVPRLGFTLAHIGVVAKGARPDRCVDDNGVQRSYTKGEKYLQLETHPSSWEPIPIGTTSFQLLTQYPNHCHHEFLDSFIQRSIGARSMYESMTSTRQSRVMFDALKSAGIWTESQDANALQKRADRRVATVVKKYGFATAKLYFDSNTAIMTCELGNVDSSKSTRMGDLDYWRGTQLKRYNSLESDSDQTDWPAECNGSGSVMHPRYKQLNGDSHLVYQGVPVDNPQAAHQQQQDVGSSYAPASNDSSAVGGSSALDPQLVNPAQPQDAHSSNMRPANSTNDLDVGQSERIHTPAEVSHVQQEAAEIQLDISCSILNGQLGCLGGLPFWTTKEDYLFFMKTSLDLLRQGHQLAGIVANNSRDKHATKSSVLSCLMDGYVISPQVKDVVVSGDRPEASSVIRLLEAAVLKQCNESQKGHDDLDQQVAQRLKQKTLFQLTHDHKTMNLALARIIEFMVTGKTIDYQDSTVMDALLRDTSMLVERTTEAVDQQLMLLENANPLHRIYFEDDYTNAICNGVVSNIIIEFGIPSQEFGSLEHFQKCLEQSKARRSSLDKDVDDNIPDSDGSLYRFTKGRLDHVVERLQAVAKQMTPALTVPSHEDSHGESDGGASPEDDSNDHDGSRSINQNNSAVSGQKAANPTPIPQAAPARGTKRRHQDTEGDEAQDLAWSRGTRHIHKKTKAQGDGFQPTQPRSTPIKPQRRPTMGQFRHPAPKRRQTVLDAGRESSPSSNIEPLAGKKRSLQLDDMDDAADDRPSRRHRSNSFVPDSSVLVDGDVSSPVILHQEPPQGDHHISNDPSHGSHDGSGNASPPVQADDAAEAPPHVAGAPNFTEISPIQREIIAFRDMIRHRLGDMDEAYDAALRKLISRQLTDNAFLDQCDFLLEDSELLDLHDSIAMRCKSLHPSSTDEELPQQSFEERIASLQTWRRGQDALRARIRS